MRGYSGSGKSTRAAEIAKETGAVIVNRDLLRLMLLGSFWTGKKDDEDRVTVAEEAQVRALLLADTSVIIDSTHLHPPHLRKWAKLATRLGVDFEVVDCPMPEEGCLIRNARRQTKGERSVDANVISKQAKQWPQEKWPTITAQPFVIEHVEWIPGLPSAIIVDIDGTLAHMREGGRSPYDYSRVHEDVVDVQVSDLVYDIYTYRESGCCYPMDDHTRVLIMSGRDDDCRGITQEWLDNHLIRYDELIMRPADAMDNHGNKLPDYQVKYALFNDHVRGKYNVRFVLDDRLQVCEMWHRLGLKLLRVGDPNSDF